MNPTGIPTFGGQLNDVGRCPHCNIAQPTLTNVWSSAGPTPRADGRSREYWGAFLCVSCGGLTTVKGTFRKDSKAFVLTEMFPKAKEAHQDIPDIARTFLQQAFDTLYAPDAAAMVAGSAVDAMLKHKGLEDGTLYARIDLALAQNILTKEMADWAHEVRLGSNRPRHADKDRPHVTGPEATQSVEFAEALANFLFVLSKRIERGIDAAKAAEGQETTPDPI